MKLTITYPQVGGSYTPFLLADGTLAPIATTSWANGAPGIIKEGLIARQRRTVQKTGLFRAAYQFITPRFNWENSFAFSVQRSFQNPKQMFLFTVTHAAAVPASGEITLTNQSTAGTIIYYLPNAVIDAVEVVDQQEVAVVFRYSVTAPNPWQSTP